MSCRSKKPAKYIKNKSELEKCHDSHKPDTRCPECGIGLELFRNKYIYKTEYIWCWKCNYYSIIV